MKIQIPADQIQVGDIVDKGNHALRVAEVNNKTPKMVRWHGVYTKCTFEPERVGRGWGFDTRRSTMLNVERAEVA